MSEVLRNLLDAACNTLHIHLGQVFGSFQFVDEGGDEGERISILNSMFIEVSVVLERAESSILLLDKEERGSLG